MSQLFRKCKQPLKYSSMSMCSYQVKYGTKPNMGLDVTKPVFGVSDKSRLKPVSSATETSYIKISLLASLNDIFQNAYNKGADQSAWMCRLVCGFVGRKPPKTGFLVSCTICSYLLEWFSNNGFLLPVPSSPYT